MLGGHLIDGHATPRVLRFARRYSAEPCSRAERVYRRSNRSLVLETADDGQLLPEFIKRLEDRREFKAGAFGGRSPAIHDRAVGEIDESHAGLWIRGGLRKSGRCRDH